MGYVMLEKDARWKLPETKHIVLPKMFITVGMDETFLAPLSTAERAGFDHIFNKSFISRSGEARVQADRNLAVFLRTKDDAVEKLASEDASSADTLKKKMADDILQELRRVGRDYEDSLKKACLASAALAYKEVKKLQLGPRQIAQAVVKIDGKVEVKQGGGGPSESDAKKEEIAAKVLRGLLYPAQDFAEALAKGSEQNYSTIEKAIKDCNALSKAMREQQKKPTPATQKLIETTQKTLDKSFDVIEKFTSSATTQARQAKLKLQQAADTLKQLEKPPLVAAAKNCAAEAQGLLDSFNKFTSCKGLIDQICKPFDRKHLPDFPKVIAALDNVNDRRACNLLTVHVDDLADDVATEAQA